MKKWVDITRSRVSAFSFRNALRSNGTGGEDNTEDETVASTGEEAQTVPDFIEATLKKKELTMEPKSTQDLSHQPAESVTSASADNITSEVVGEGKTSAEGNNAKDVQRSSDEYDPLGVLGMNEVQYLKDQALQYSQELEAARHRAAELERELSASKDLTSQLEQSRNIIEDLEMQLQSVKDEFQRFRKQSESNLREAEEKVAFLTEQLHHHSRPGRTSHSRSLSEHLSECTFVPRSSCGNSLGGETQSTEMECSFAHDVISDEVEESNKKILHLMQSLRTMGVKQTDLQRRLSEAQDERDYLKSVMEDLQKQVDASSPEVSAHLRATLQAMEIDVARLEEENAVLRRKICIHQREELEETDASEGMMSRRESPAFGALSQRIIEEGPSEVSEELVDCSLEIMGELANAAADVEVGISMSYVQYAGLLAAIQKAIKQLEASKESFSQSTDSFKFLDRTLSKTLSISRFRVRPPQGEGEKRLEALLVMIKEKESGLKFMEQMIADLRVEMKGHQSITLQQEVQLEYLKQQLSSSDKVISLTWEVENLKKSLEESQRELKAQRDLNEQQQQELTIQWQSKQQAVAETLSQNHRVFSFSQQLEHVVEANEALEAEKQELEEALEQARVETEELREQCSLKIHEIYRETAPLKDETKERHTQKSRVLTAQDCQDVIASLHSLEKLIDVLKGPDSDLTAQKSSLFNLVLNLDTQCAAWKESSLEQGTELEKLKKEVEELTEKLSVAESMRLRAEQEKTGVQEILSLTSETTSTEIMRLQTQLSELTRKFEKEQERAEKASVSAEKQILDLQSHLESTEAALENLKIGAAEEIQLLKEKLETANKENLNLETRMRSYKDVISGLNRDLSSSDGKLKDLNKIADQSASAYRVEKERADGLEQEVCQCRREIEKQLQERSELQDQCLQMGSLKESLDVLSIEKAQLAEQLTKLQSSHEELQNKHKISLEHLEAVKAQKEKWLQERHRFEEQLMEEQQNLVEARTKWEAEISALVERDMPRNRWPSAVLTIVQKCEALVLDAVTREKESKVEEMQLLLEESKAKAESAESFYQEQVVECGEEIRSLQETIEKLQQEMKERESVLQQDIADIQGQKEEKMTQLEEQLTSVQALYSTLQEDAERKEHELQQQLDQKDFQLTETQSKAREMMKERDAEIESLKQIQVQRHPSPDDIPDDDPSKAVILKLQSDVQFLRHLVLDLTSSLEQSERTHELRNQADQVIKDELNSYERSRKREGLDMDYVKNVLVNAFEKGTLPKTSPIFMVLARLFEFSPEEMERIRISEKPCTPSHSSSSLRSTGSIFSAWMRS